MLFRIYLFLIYTFCTFSLYGQTATVSGYITDASSGEPLISANVYHAGQDKGTVANIYGFYSYTGDTGLWELQFSYIGYQSKTIQLRINNDTTINIELKPSVDLDVVEVKAGNVERIEENTQMSAISLPVDQINKLPAFLGERDVLKALQLMPGVQSGGEGQAGLYVRGGSPDQNLILLDGVPVYNANHVFGFFSVFNTDALKDVDLIKGGFPARYGGRLSSVLDIRMKEGNKKEFGGSASIGFIASKLMLEGPIGKNENTSFIVAARRTYIDLLIAPFLEEGIQPQFYFYDLNAKINHKFSEKDQLFLSVYGGDDKYGIKEEYESSSYRDNTEIGLQWGNITTALRWNHVWNNRLFSNVTTTYSRYRFDNSNSFRYEERVNGDYELQEETALGYDSGIRDFGLKLDFDYLPTPDHYIRFGASSTFHRFDPGGFDLLYRNDSETLIDTIINQDILYAWEHTLYAEDDWNITDLFKVNYGLHFSAFATEGKTYFSAQPRLSARYLLGNKWSVKASYAQMRQYIQLLTNENLSLPTDLWLPSTSKVRPQDAWQVAMGVAKTFSNKIEFSTELYYKNMSNVLSFKEGSSFFEFTDWQERVTQGNGESYGLELLLQKKHGALTGWIGYTLSWSTRQFEDINFGRRYPFKYDRRHDLSIVAMYDISEKIRLSSTWVYGTGYAVTLAYDRFNYNYNAPTGNDQNYFGIEYIIDNYDSKNNYRMPNYHRMDLGIDFIKKKKTLTRTWSLGAYNVYNRNNAFFLFEGSEPVTNPDGSLGQKTVLQQASLFPIIPYINLKYDF